jgi:hypothetical protein
MLGLVVLACVGCLGEQVTFEGLRDADRIEVTTRHGQLTTAVHDPSVIAAVHAMVAKHDSGWSTPRYGTPEPLLHVSFYRGTRLLGGFGLGKDFLTSGPGPKFMMRSVPTADIAAIARMLQVPLGNDSTPLHRLPGETRRAPNNPSYEGRAARRPNLVDHGSVRAR